MKQKYLIQKLDGSNDLSIREYANLDREYKFSDWANLDKEYFSFLGEEIYDRKQISAAIKKGKGNLILALRTRNMYPIGDYADEIAAGIIELYDSKKNRTLELLFDDKQVLFDQAKTDN
jgi:hypothetical protein